MKSLLRTLLLLSLMITTLHAQDEEQTEETGRRSRHGLVGGGGGVVPTWLFLNTNELNISLAGSSLPELSNSGMFMMGGGGFVYVGFIKNFRMGGVGAGGSMSEERTDNGIYKSTKMSMSYGGVSLEYVIPFGDFHISIGGVLGGGSSTITLSKSTTGVKTWGTVFDDFKSQLSSTGSRYELTNSFFSYQPSIAIEYVLHPLVMAKLTGGYFGIVGNSWQMDEQFDVTNVPDLKLGSGFIQLGIYVGAFLSN